MNISNFDYQFKLKSKKEILNLRAKLTQAIRLYFINNNFLEVETPLRIPAPAPEEHIEAIPSGYWFLQTSPELCMKRLLAADYSRIFQISKCFRDKERGKKHLPEFTMLEWYVAQYNYLQLMNQCEKMLIAVLKYIGFDENIVWQNKKINFSSPWEKITVTNAFCQYAPITMKEALLQDKFDEIMVEYIEPHLGIDRPIFIYDYPAKNSTLAKSKPDDPDLAERFELYIGSLELANGFSELIDEKKQRKNFEEALKSREQKKWAKYKMPEKFLSSLVKMPEASGIALGIDRLVMLISDTDCIDDVVAFTPDII